MPDVHGELHDFRLMNWEDGHSPLSGGASNNVNNEGGKALSGLCMIHTGLHENPQFDLELADSSRKELSLSCVITLDNVDFLGQPESWKGPWTAKSVLISLALFHDILWMWQEAWQAEKL